MTEIEKLREMSENLVKAKLELWNAVKANLIEINRELPIVYEDENTEELGYPKGLLMNICDKHNMLVDCVYDKVKVEKGRVFFHQCYWCDGSEDHWQSSDELSYDDLIIISDYIQWA